MAYQNLKILNEWENNYTHKKNEILEIILNNGKKMKVHPSWHGYFDSLEEHNVVPLRLIK